jgi:hypothetical protein
MRVLGVSAGARATGLVIVVTGERWRYEGTLWSRTVQDLQELCDLVGDIAYTHRPLVIVELPHRLADLRVACWVEGICRAYKCRVFHVQHGQVLKEHRLYRYNRARWLDRAIRLAKPPWPPPKTPEEAMALLTAITGVRLWYWTDRKAEAKSGHKLKTI